jgi:hypothetical protein
LRFDPTIATRNTAETPPHRSDLNGQVAVLDSLAAPDCFDQVILQDKRAGPFDQHTQHRDRAPTQRDGLITSQQQVALGIQTKWSQNVNRHPWPA